MFRRTRIHQFCNMQEAQQDTQKETGKGHGGTVALWATIIMVCLYFLLPGLLMYPFRLAYGKWPPPPRVFAGLQVFFTPVNMLMERSEIYGNFLGRQFVFFGEVG
jgi:hypothetical protein